MKLYCDPFTSKDLFLAFRDVGDHFVLHYLHISMMDFIIVQQFEQKHSFATMLFGVIFLANFYPRPVLAFGYCHRLRLCVCPCVCVCQSLACPHDNLGPVQARIAKFGPKMQKTLVPIVFGGN